MWSFGGVSPGGRPWRAVPGIAHEPEISEHSLDKSKAWLVFIGSGPCPEGQSRNDSTFPHLAMLGLRQMIHSVVMAGLVPAIHGPRQPSWPGLLVLV